MTGQVHWDPFFHNTVCWDPEQIAVIPSCYGNPDEVLTDSAIADIVEDFSWIFNVWPGQVPDVFQARARGYTDALEKMLKNIHNLTYRAASAGHMEWRVFILVQDSKSWFSGWTGRWKTKDVGKPYWVEVKGLKGWIDGFGYNTAREALDAGRIAADYYPFDPPYRKWCNGWQDKWNEKYNPGVTVPRDL